VGKTQTKPKKRGTKGQNILEFGEDQTISKHSVFSLPFSLSLSFVKGAASRPWA
jgi:hypothetical protein